MLTRGGGGGGGQTSYNICLVIKVKYVLSLQMRQQLLLSHLKRKERSHANISV